MSTSLRSGDVLDVLSSTPAGVAGRAPRIHRPLTRLVTILCEKSGLAAFGRTTWISATAGSASFDAAFSVRGWSFFDCDGHFV